MTDRPLMQIGAIAGIVGAIVFAAGNMLHPRSSDIEVYSEQIKTVSASGIWLTDHLLFIFGALLMLAFLVALRHAITTGAAGALARLGYVGGLVSTGTLTVLIGLDGIASKAIHDAWAAAPEAEKATALRIAEAMEQVDVGVFSVWIIVFFGVTFILYGLAVAMSDLFPKWLGWAATVLGVISLAVGTFQAYDGLSEVTTNYLFAGSATMLTVWVLVMGVLMWRKISRMDTQPA